MLNLKNTLKNPIMKKHITGFFIDKDLFINKVRINILLVLETKTFTTFESHSINFQINYIIF